MLADLGRGSARPYAARVSDQEDFAQVYESTIWPALVDILQAHYDSDFSIDVHRFSDLNGESVQRVIYITLSKAATVQLQDLVHEELARKLPPSFHQTRAEFRQGSVEKTVESEDKTATVTDREDDSDDAVGTESHEENVEADGADDADDDEPATVTGKEYDPTNGVAHSPSASKFEERESTGQSTVR